MSQLLTAGIAFGGIMIPVIGTLVKLYGDIRVLQSNDRKNREILSDVEKSKQSLHKSVNQIQVDLEYIKKDAEENKEFRTLVYDFMIKPKAII